MTPATIALALQLAEQGISYFEGLRDRANSSEVTQADVDEAAAKLDVDLAQLEADIKAKG